MARALDCSNPPYSLNGKPHAFWTGNFDDGQAFGHQWLTGMYVFWNGDTEVSLTSDSNGVVDACGRTKGLLHVESASACFAAAQRLVLGVEKNGA